MGELETAAENQSYSPFAPVQTPRLGILHLMLWTFCSAVHLALMRVINALRVEMPSEYAVIQDASNVMQSVLSGAVFMGAIVLVSTRIRGGRPMLSQPGHWLLFVSAMFYLIFLPLSLTQLLMQYYEFGGTSIFVLFGMIYLLPALAYGVAARRIQLLRWKVIFVALVVLNLTHGLYLAGIWLAGIWLAGIWISQGVFIPWIRVLSTIASSGRLLLAAAVLTVSLSDLTAGRRYDWLHWIGVATFVMGSSVTLLWMIGSWFIR